MLRKCFSSGFCYRLEVVLKVEFQSEVVPYLVQSERSSGEALRTQILGNEVQVEHGLVDLVDGVLGVDGRQLLGQEHLLWRLNHALGMVVTQLHTGADDGAAKPLAQDLQGRASEAEPVRQTREHGQIARDGTGRAALIGRVVIPVPLV